MNESFENNFSTHLENMNFFLIENFQTPEGEILKWWKYSRNSLEKFNHWKDKNFKASLILIL